MRLARSVGVPVDFSQLLRIILLLAVFGSPSGVYAGESHAPTPREAREILTAVCSPSRALDATTLPGSYGGCEPCPSFTEWGKLPIVRKNSFGLDAVIYGSFTAPGVREAVATFGGCVDHAAAPDFRGSVVLVRRGHVWRMRPNGYVQGIDTSKCLTYDLQGGREILVCQSFEGHPDVSYEGIFRWNFKAKRAIRGLITTMNTWGACQDAALEESISGFGIRSFPGSKIPGLGVEIKVAQVRHAGRLGVCAGSYSAPRPTTCQVDFLAGGRDFEVAPWSAATMRRLDRLFTSAR